MRTSAPAEPLALPVELVAALACVEDGPQLWERQCEDMKELHARWIAEPCLAAERRLRAEQTAFHLAHGSLPQAVQRPRWYDVVGEILGAAIPI